MSRNEKGGYFSHDLDFILDIIGIRDRLALVLVVRGETEVWRDFKVTKSTLLGKGRAGLNPQPYQAQAGSRVLGAVLGGGASLLPCWVPRLVLLFWKC